MKDVNPKLDELLDYFCKKNIYTSNVPPAMSPVMPLHQATFIGPVEAPVTVPYVPSVPVPDPVKPSESIMESLTDAVKRGMKSGAAGSANKAALAALEKAFGDKYPAFLKDPLGRRALGLALPVLVLAAANMAPEQVNQIVTIEHVQAGCQLAIQDAVSSAVETTAKEVVPLIAPVFESFALLANPDVKLLEAGAGQDAGSVKQISENADAADGMVEVPEQPIAKRPAGLRARLHALLSTKNVGASIWTPIQNLFRYIGGMIGSGAFYFLKGSILSSIKPEPDAKPAEEKEAAHAEAGLAAVGEGTVLAPVMAVLAQQQWYVLAPIAISVSFFVFVASIFWAISVVLCFPFVMIYRAYRYIAGKCNLSGKCS